MFHEVRDVSAKPDFRLCVEFANGSTKVYDVVPLFNRFPAFKHFESNPEAFFDVHVDVGAHGIVWNDELDLSCEELWEGGETIETPFDGILALSDATHLWGLSESALRKAIAYGRLQRGADVAKFGKQWVVTAAAMRREYGEPNAA